MSQHKQNKEKLGKVNPFTGKNLEKNERLSDFIPLETQRQEHYSKARKRFEEEVDFELVASDVGELIKAILIDIVKEVISDSEKEIRDKVYQAIEYRKAKNVSELKLIDLGRILDDETTGLMSSLETHLGEYYMVLRTYNFESIGIMATEPTQLGKNKISKKIAAHQLLNLTSILLAAHENMVLTSYHFLVNFDEITKEVERIRNEQSKTHDATTEYCYLPITDKLEDEKQFVWYKQRGMLLNKADQSRNIAFKVESFVNILKSIYRGILKCTNPTDGGLDIDTVARRIIFNAGFVSGSEFGWTMHEIAQRKDFDDDDIESIIKLWCEFDSDVGFGMLSLVVEENDAGNQSNPNELRYVIRLTDNFAVYKQDAQGLNLCGFVGGYIRGVMERLTGQPMTIEHSPEQCAQIMANRNHCDFIVATNDNAYKQILEDAKKKHVDLDSLFIEEKDHDD